MTESVTIKWLCRQIAERTGSSEQEALEVVRNAMIAGEISAFTPQVDYYPANTEQFEKLANYGRKSAYKFPSNLWEKIMVDLEEQHPYFHFYDEHGVYLTTSVYVSQASALKFVKSKDPLYLAQTFETAAAPVIVTIKKGIGGAPTKINWEKCLIEAARWMFSSGVPAQQADLVRYIAEWLGSAAPSETQLKAHLAPLYRALREVDHEQ